MPVSARQSGAISRDTLLHNLLAGEVLPPARTNEREMELIRKEPDLAVRVGPRSYGERRRQKWAGDSSTAGRWK